MRQSGDWAAGIGSRRNRNLNNRPLPPPKHPITIPRHTALEPMFIPKVHIQFADFPIRLSTPWPEHFLLEYLRRFLVRLFVNSRVRAALECKGRTFTAHHRRAPLLIQIFKEYTSIDRIPQKMWNFSDVQSTSRTECIPLTSTNACKALVGSNQPVFKQKR